MSLATSSIVSVATSLALENISSQPVRAVSARLWPLGRPSARLLPLSTRPSLVCWLSKVFSATL